MKLIALSKLVAGCVYRSPNACSDTFIDLLNDSLSKLPVGSQIVLLGDFSIYFLAQKNGASLKLKRQQRQFAIANDLEKLINFPTRICEQTRTAIDLVFVNNTHCVVESGVIHSAISDLSIVYCTMKSGVPKHLPKSIEYRSYRKYDKSSFIKDLKETDWNMVDLNGDVDPAVEMWNTLFTDFANRHAPIKKEQKHREMYKNMKNFVNRQVKKCKAEYYSDLINKNKGNPGELWKTFNEITSKKSN